MKPARPMAETLGLGSLPMRALDVCAPPAPVSSSMRRARSSLARDAIHGVRELEPLARPLDAIGKDGDEAGEAPGLAIVGEFVDVLVVAVGAEGDETARRRERPLAAIGDPA